LDENKKLKSPAYKVKYFFVEGWMKIYG